MDYMLSISGSAGRKIVFALPFCVVTSLIPVACRQTIKSLPENGAVVSQLCQLRQQLRIGFYGGPNLVTLNPCDTDANESVVLEKSPPRTLSTFDYSSDRSPDGKWLAKTGDHEISLWDQATAKSRVVIRADKFLTPPRWSPDSNFVFVVTSENRDKKRSIVKCGDDIFEIYVVNAQSGTGAIVGRVCAGVPFGAFRWLQQGTVK